MKHILSIVMCFILICNAFSVISYGENGEGNKTASSQEEIKVTERDSHISEEIQLAAEKEFNTTILNDMNRKSFKDGIQLGLNSRNITDYYYDEKSNTFAAVVEMEHYYVVSLGSSRYKESQTNFAFVTGSYDAANESVSIKTTYIPSGYRSSYTNDKNDVKERYDEWVSTKPAANKNTVDPAEKADVKISEGWIDDFNTALRKASNEEYKQVSKQQNDNVVEFSGDVFQSQDFFGSTEVIDVDGYISPDNNDCQFDWTIKLDSIGNYYQNTSSNKFASDKRNIINQNIGPYSYSQCMSIVHIMYFTNLLSQISLATEDETIEAVFSSSAEEQVLGQWLVKSDISDDNNKITFHVVLAA